MSVDIEDFDKFNRQNTFLPLRIVPVKINMNLENHFVVNFLILDLAYSWKFIFSGRIIYQQGFV